MILLIHSSDGRIAHSQFFNKAHDAHIPERVREILDKYHKRLGFRVILVDDKPSPNSHKVIQDDTGIRVVKMDDDDPFRHRQLSRLLDDTKRVGHAGKRPLFYVQPAASDPDELELEDAITIFCPMSGKPYGLKKFLAALDALELPSVPVDLLFRDNSHSPAIAGILKDYLRYSDKFRNAFYVLDASPQAHGQWQGTVHKVWRAYTYMAQAASTEYVMTIEDDVLVPPNALTQCHDIILTDTTLSAVGGAVPERADRRIMAWAFSSTNVVSSSYVSLDALKDGLIHSLSYSATLFRTRILKTTPIRPSDQSNPDHIATDITMFWEMWKNGHSTRVLCQVPCRHLLNEAECVSAPPIAPEERCDIKPCDAVDDLKRLSKRYGAPLSAVKYNSRPILLPKEYNPAATIQMTVKDNPEATREAIQSILDTAPHTEVIVYDNGSESETQEVLASLEPRIQVIRNDQDAGFILPHNHMAELAQGEIIVIASSDIVVQPGWLEAIQEALSSPEVGIAGPMLQRGRLDELGRGRDADRFFPREIEYLDRALFAIARRTYENHGLFDSEHLTFATSEDVDLSLRLRSLGYKIMPLELCKITHASPTAREAPTPEATEAESKNLAHVQECWAPYLRTRSFPPHRILIRRWGGNGDLIAAEPAIKGIRLKHPNSHITLQTSCVEIMEGCPHVNAVTDANCQDACYAKVVDLDMAYENRPGENISRCMCAVAGVSYSRPAYWLASGSLDFAIETMDEGADAIVVHPHAGWTNKLCSREVLAAACEELSKDFRILEVGSIKDEPWKLGEPMYGTTLPETAALISLSRLVIAHDSVCLHLAAALDRKSVGLFGPTRAELTMDTTMMTEVRSDEECQGCHHEPPFPKKGGECKHESAICMASIRPEMIIEAARRAL